MTTTKTPDIKIDEEILLYLQPEEEGTTIVHCRINVPFPTLARIWSSTFLVEEDGSKVPLVKAFHIAMAPEWSWLKSENGFITFTLLFEGLSKSCKHFTLVEDIDQPGGFYSGKIERNKTDIYQVELSF